MKDEKKSNSRLRSLIRYAAAGMPLLLLTLFLCCPDLITSRSSRIGFLLFLAVFYSGAAIAVLIQRNNKRKQDPVLTEKSHLSCLLASTEQNNHEEEYNIDKSTFFAALSHDLRTSINTICGMSELLANQETTTDIEKEYAHTIQLSARNLLNTVNDILDYSELDAGTLTLLHTKYNLFSCLKELQNAVNIQIGKKDITFLMHINSSIPYRFYGDEPRIYQVLITLLSNSIHFTKCGKISLDVDFRKVDDEYADIIMTISDTGAGMPKDQQSSLFNGFSLIAGDDEHNHFGINLIISQRLARLLGGSLTFQSASGKGTTFMFTIRQQMYIEFPLGESSSYEHCQIAVYEPNEYYCIALKQMFEELQVLYRFYSTPEELLKHLQDREDFYILFDSTTGLPILKDSLLQLQKTVPIAMLTINEQIHSAESELFLSVSKPLSCYTLIPILDKTLKKETKTKVSSINSFIAPEARILIVDDNRVNLKVAEGLIKTFQCDITTLRNGRKAVELIEHGEIFDIIFMDHMMPDLDGIETTRILRDIPTPYAQQVPIIALSANTINGAREMFIENDMNDFLAKPIEMGQLNVIMAKYIDKDKQIPVENNA